MPGELSGKCRLPVFDVEMLEIGEQISNTDTSCKVGVRQIKLGGGERKKKEKGDRRAYLGTHGLSGAFWTTGRSQVDSNPSRPAVLVSLILASIRSPVR